MLRHVVCLKFVDGTGPERLEDLRDALVALPAAIPEIRSYQVGLDAGLADGNADLVVVAEFDDAAGWRAYQSHPAHVRVIDELIRPILATRAAAQFEL